MRKCLDFIFEKFKLLRSKEMLTGTQLFVKFFSAIVIHALQVDKLHDIGCVIELLPLLFFFRNFFLGLFILLLSLH